MSVRVTLGISVWTVDKAIVRYRKTEETKHNIIIHNDLESKLREKNDLKC